MATDPFADRRSNEVADGIAQEVFSPADLQLSPEEYAARRGHLWALFSLDEYPYRDPTLGAWVRRLGEILHNRGELERCRQRFLTPEELEAVRKKAEEF
jgi:hypothetical protein